MPVASPPTAASSLRRVSPRQDAILQGALACFTRLGYANATIDDVRRASGASVGSIYHHFGDKEGLAGALYVEGLRRYQADLVGAVLGGATGQGARTARTLIRGIVRHSIDWMIAYPDWSRFLFEMRRAEGVQAVEEIIRRDTKAFFGRLTARMERHIEHGEIRSLPMEVMGALLIGPAQELVRHWLRAGVPDNASRIREELADAAWRSIRTDKTSGRTGTRKSGKAKRP